MDIYFDELHNSEDKRLNLVISEIIKVRNEFLNTDCFKFRYSFYAIFSLKR